MATKLPTLDEETKKGLNEVTEEDIEVSYAYNHEILWYGICAVAHTHVMRMARDIAEGKISQDEFVKKYELDFESEKYGFVLPLKKIENHGIFIPSDAYYSDANGLERTISFFDSDYNNRIMFHESWVDKEYAYKLVEKLWQPSDLANAEVVEQGVKFGRDMWQTCVEGFNRVKGGSIKGTRNGKDIYGPAQPKKVTDLAEKLIAYYSEFISL